MTERLFIFIFILIVVVIEILNFTCLCVCYTEDKQPEEYKLDKRQYLWHSDPCVTRPLKPFHNLSIIVSRIFEQNQSHIND